MACQEDLTMPMDNILEVQCWLGSRSVDRWENHRGCNDLSLWGGEGRKESFSEQPTETPSED